MRAGEKRGEKGGEKEERGTERERDDRRDAPVAPEEQPAEGGEDASDGPSETAVWRARFHPAYLSSPGARRQAAQPLDLPQRSRPAA